jgi:hypothetical protein
VPTTSSASDRVIASSVAASVGADVGRSAAWRGSSVRIRSPALGFHDVAALRGGLVQTVVQALALVIG